MLYELRDIKRFYNDRCALSVDRLAIEGGKIYGLVGPNGSGKTTLLRILAFLDEPSEGQIIYKGSFVTSQKASLFRQEVTMLLQNARLLTRKVKDNVAYGLKLRGYDSKTIKSRVVEALEMVGLQPRDFLNRAWHELSGGEAQRVALAARLALRPNVLLLDEPTANVDKVSEALINQAVIKAKREWKTTIIMVSHDLGWLYSTADEILSLWGGRIVRQGPENIIPGPWEKLENGLYCKRLRDGQKIYLSGTPSQSGVVSISPSEILLAEYPERTSARNLLYGFIREMAYCNGSQIRVTLSIGEINLVALITDEAARELKLSPGMNIYVVFKATAAKWL